MTDSSVDHVAQTQARDRCRPGARVAVVLISWCFAQIAIFLTIILSMVVLAGDDLLLTKLLVLLPLFAWVALAVMSVRWVQNRVCHWLWPILGTLSGGMSAVLYFPGFFFYISAVPLAIYLVFWHLWGKVNG